MSECRRTCVLCREPVLPDLPNGTNQYYCGDHLTPKADSDCAWCGGSTDHTGHFPNRRGETFCSKNHRTASNRALRNFMRGHR